MNAITEIHTPVELRLGSYDRIVVAFSGGKDCLASVLHLLDLGVPREKIELHHHDVDGGSGRHFMDWPITYDYCAAVAEYLGIRLYFSWKVGGFEREMMRENARTAPMMWQTADGFFRTVGGDRGKASTRRRFPQVSADLSVRWCSAYLKIDVLSALLRNEPRFAGSRTLVVTGERAQESPARSRYRTFEPDRADNRNGRSGRHIDHWRPAHGWDEQRVWLTIARHRIRPHPAYQIGWSRLSCMSCIFGSDNQWATIQAIAPERIEAIAGREEDFGVTIHRTRSVRERAARGTPYAAALARPEAARLAMGTVYDLPVLMEPWELPAGAYGEAAGPT